MTVVAALFFLTGCRANRGPLSDWTPVVRPQLTAAQAIAVLRYEDPPAGGTVPVLSKMPLVKRRFTSLGPGWPAVYHRLAYVRMDGRYTPRSTDEAAWLALMNDPSADIVARLGAARFLIPLGSGPGKAFVLEQLASKDRVAVHNAAMILVCIADEDPSPPAWLMETLTALLNDDRLLKPSADAGNVYRTDVFDEICRALGRTKHTAAVPALMAVLTRHPDNAPAAYALANLADPAAEPVLLQTLQKPDGSLQPAQVEALGKIRSTRVVPQLLQTLEREDDETGVQGVAIGALRDIGDARAIEPLRAYFGKAAAPHKTCARIALAMLESKDAGRALLELLQNESESDARVALIYQLAQLKEHRAVKPLLATAADPHDRLSVRLACIFALGEIGGDDAARGLVGLFDVDFTDTREVRKGRLDVGQCIADALVKATGTDLGPAAGAADWRRQMDSK